MILQIMYFDLHFSVLHCITLAANILKKRKCEVHLLYTVYMVILRGEKSSLES